MKRIALAGILAVTGIAMADDDDVTFDQIGPKNGSDLDGGSGFPDSLQQNVTNDAWNTGSAGADCPWDLDGDDNVGTGDLILLLGSWGDPFGTAELIELLGAWGPCRELECTFADDFEDGRVDSRIYEPIHDARLVERDGQLLVIPTGPSAGVLINNPCPIPDPVSSTNLVEQWRYEIVITPAFADDEVGSMRMESIGDDGRAINCTLYDNVKGQIVFSEGDRFGGVQTTHVSQFIPNAAIREENEHECTWIPPGWSTGKCCGYVVPRVVYWKFGAFGDAPLDPSLNDVALHGIRLVSTESFSIDCIEIESGNETGGVEAWRLSPSHVRTVGGETVELTGAGFNDLRSFTITLNGIPAENVQIVDDSTMTFETPPGQEGLALVLLETLSGELRVMLDNDLRYYASPEPLLLSREPLPVGMNGVPYSTQITANGGIGIGVFSLASGSLPAGVTLQSDGAVSGTPSEVGVFAFFVQVTDESAEEDVRMFFLEVQ